MNLTFADPARDITLPGRVPSTTRPLATEEAELVWLHAWDGGRPTRHPATIALLLAGAQTGEVGHITIPDLDVPNARVFAHGASKYNARWLPLEPYALQALRARAEHLVLHHPEAAAATVRLATGAGGSDAHLQSRVGMTVGEIFQRAGFGDDPDLRPASLTATAGVRAFNVRGRIEDAAMVMGVRSLDAAAKAIRFAWDASAQD